MSDDIPDWVKARHLSAVNALAFEKTRPTRLSQAKPLDLESVADTFLAHDMGHLVAANELPGDVWILIFVDGERGLKRTLTLYENRGEWEVASVVTTKWSGKGW